MYDKIHYKKKNKKKRKKKKKKRRRQSLELWSYKDQGKMPKIAGSHQKPGERHGTDSASGPPKGTKADANPYLRIE